MFTAVQMNVADSERMGGLLDSMGYQNTDEADEADLVVYNTCSIRDKSEQKVSTASGNEDEGCVCPCWERIAPRNRL